MRIFLDTNVLASSIATRGLCAELVESIIDEHQLLTCEPVLEELERVLAGKFRLPDSMIRTFIGLLRSEGTIIGTQERPTIKFKDAGDIPILACAVVSGADAFVTGDKDLLELGAVENLAILSPRQIWEKLAGLESGGRPE